MADGERGSAVPSAGREAVEKLAALSHEQWAGWAAWMIEHWDQRHASGELFLDRWRRQIRTPYADLSEEEKESDRIEARKEWRLMCDAATARAARAEAERDKFLNIAKAYWAGHMAMFDEPFNPCSCTPCRLMRATVNEQPAAAEPAGEGEEHGLYR